MMAGGAELEVRCCVMVLVVSAVGCCCLCVCVCVMLCMMCSGAVCDAAAGGRWGALLSRPLLSM